MIEQKEFTIASRPELKLRIGKITTVELLSLQLQINFESLAQTEVVFNFILEHIEVFIANNWQPLKTPNRDLYYPTNIESDFNALQDICIYFLNDIVKPLFKKSNE